MSLAEPGELSAATLPALLADIRPERRHPANAKPLRGGAPRQH